MGASPFEIGAEVSTRTGVKPQNSTSAGTINGAAIDRMPTGSQQGYLSCELWAASGTNFTGTAPTLDTKIQDSADGATGWADLLDRDGNVVALDQIAAADTEERLSVDLAPAKQYIRVVQTLGGTVTSMDHVAAAVLGGTINPPVD